MSPQVWEIQARIIIAAEDWRKKQSDRFFRLAEQLCGEGPREVHRTWEVPLGLVALLILGIIVVGC